MYRNGSQSGNFALPSSGLNMFNCQNLGDGVGGGCHWHLVDKEARMLLNILEKCVCGVVCACVCAPAPLVPKTGANK